MFKLSRILENENIDVVNAQHFMPTVYAYYGCRRNARALVFTAHSSWELEDAPLKWRVAGGYLLRRISASVGVTSEVSHTIEREFGTQAVTIENGIDIDMFAGGRQVGNQRRSLGLTSDELVIGIVANMKKVKNHLFLLQAFARVAEEYSNVKLLIIGQGFPGEIDNTEAELRLFVTNQGLTGRVLFLGYRTDIAELLQAMDLFCLTSLREGLPIGLLEAMACSLPVVATNVEGARDVIEHEKDGMLVESGDIESLATTLIDLLRDPALRLRLGAAARRKAVDKYSLKRCVEEYENLFLAAAGGRAMACGSATRHAKGLHDKR
jgi:glycosyltransferase involved in cell wall biosynthesis